MKRPTPLVIERPLRALDYPTITKIDDASMLVATYRECPSVSEAEADG